MLQGNRKQIQCPHSFHGLLCLKRTFVDNIGLRLSQHKCWGEKLVFLFVVVQLLSCVQLFASPWTAEHQASLSFTISLSLLKLIAIESVMLSNHLILCLPLLLLPSIFPSIRVSSNELALHIGGQSIGASALVLPMNIQDLFTLGLTGLISLLSKGLAGVFSSTTT